MIDLPEGFERIPPRDDESPEEIRRQRDFYRDMFDMELIRRWKNYDPAAVPRSPDGGRGEIRMMIEELEAGLARE